MRNNKMNQCVDLHSLHKNVVSSVIGYSDGTLSSINVVSLHESQVTAHGQSQQLEQRQHKSHMYNLSLQQYKQS